MGRRLGQHFLRGKWAAHLLVEAVNIHPDEVILEIGPGRGALTQELLATGARVVAIEKDGALVALLRNTFADQIVSSQLELIERDIRDFDPAAHHLLRSTNYVLAANIPYYITGEILRQFLSTSIKPRAAALLVQKEVAERIVAKSKGKESVLSLSVKAYGEPRIVAKVGRGNFSPPPKVDSSILVVENISRKFFEGISEEAFFKVVRAGFASKRKKLVNNLTGVFGKEQALRSLAFCSIDTNARAEDVPLLKWKCITKQLQASSFEVKVSR